VRDGHGDAVEVSQELSLSLVVQAPGPGIDERNESWEHCCTTVVLERER
jgi:hypothetical protein